MSDALPIPADYAELLVQIKARVREAQVRALRAANRELVGLYWGIGELIGFSASNLWRMRGLVEAYGASEKLAPLVREVGWSHNLVIMARCKDPLEREFYLRMTRKFGWSKSVLTHQIEDQRYQQTLLGQSNFDQALSPELRAQAKLAVRDAYVFDFLELGEAHSERELERALIGRVEGFLRAMGGVFAFVGSQFRLEVEGDEFFIDLLLYHRGLRALVAIELKIGTFQPEFVGKMQFYLTALDRQVRLEGEGPSIGIILCKEKNRTVVEYTLHDARKPIGVATYRVHRELPAELKGMLPGPEEIARWLEGVG